LGGVLGYGGQLSEGVWFSNGDVGQYLAIQFNAGLLEAVHEPSVRQIVLSGGGIDPLNPQPPEIALLAPAIAIGVRP
jgi:hypothetical protein